MAEKLTLDSEENKEDIISTLPDTILHKILSLLPIKTAVTTGCLSRRWHHIWQEIQMVDFIEYDDHVSYLSRKLPERSEHFRNFSVMVNSVLCLLRNPIRKFTLECCHYLEKNDKFREYSVNAWVHSVIGPHLQVLTLSLFSFAGDPSFKIPQSLFTSTNLVILRLTGRIDVHVQSNTVVNLPSLKNLVIKIMEQEHVEVSSINALLRGCPMIKILYLYFSPKSLDKICIPPCLKWLKIANLSNIRTYLDIDAPELEGFIVTRVILGGISNICNLNNVKKALLDVGPHDDFVITHLHTFLSDLSRCNDLMLSHDTIKYLLGEKPHDLHFKDFGHLHTLRLLLPSCNSNSLLNLLHKCPILEYLKIQNFEKEGESIIGWDPPASVPKCLISHLKRFQFKQFKAHEQELAFVEYVLENGIVLETLVMDEITMDLKDKYEILKRLSNVPKASRLCKLILD